MVALVGLAAIWPTQASAQATYRGLHPIDLDGHWHLEDAEHVHDGLPVGDAPFGEVDDVLVFLGDPLAYGYDGEVWTFANAHPLPGGISGYCGISRAHRHPWAPEGGYRRSSNGSYRYIGAMRGGWTMTEPARIAPATPVIAAPPAGSSAPFLWAGCMHALAPGSRGGVVVAPTPGCVPARAARGRATRAARPAQQGSYFDGNYTRTGRSPLRNTRVRRSRTRN